MAADEIKNGSQVISRAASIMKCLEKTPTGLSITEVARQTNLPRSTVHRLVASLENEHLLQTENGVVRLGAALARLAASAHKDIITLSRPAIETLGRRTRETVDLCVFRGTHAISVSQFVSDQELRVVSAVGTAFPCHCTAHGKALLAQLGDDEIKRLFSTTPESRTLNTLNNLESILKEVTLVRHRHYAVDNEEHAVGVCGLGIAIQAPVHERYAVSLAVPAQRFELQQANFLAALKQCQAEIEALISG